MLTHCFDPSSCPVCLFGITGASAMNSYVAPAKPKPAIPTQSLNQGFKYEPSYDTDIRRLFKRVREDYEAAP